MSVRRVEGRTTTLGHVRIRLPTGLVAVVAPDEPSRASFLKLLRGRILGTYPGSSGDADRPPASWDLPPGVSVDDLVELRVGLGRAGPPSDVLRGLSVIFARFAGMGRIDEAMASLERDEAVEVREPRSQAELDDPSTDRLEAARQELAVAERELRDLRADHAELAGEVEAATMDWLRERQDAETHLQAYRDRARELRDRLTHLEEAGREAPCPTCRRVLGTHFDTVATELRDEWESVVQDGRWWKRRREQLDPKPQSLREIEARSLRLQAAMERSAERVERSRLRKRARERSLVRVESARDDGAEVEAGAAPSVLVAMRRLRESLVQRSRDGILNAGSHLLLRLSGGRILGMSWDEVRDSVVLQGIDGVLDDPVESDQAAAVLALRLGASMPWPEGGEPGLLAIGDPFDAADEETRLRTLQVLAERRRRIPQVLVVTGGEIVDACPEAFDAVVELPASGHGRRTYIRPRTSGIDSIRLMP